MGYELNLQSNCINGERIDSAKYYYYITQTGFVDSIQADNYHAHQKLLKIPGDVIIAMADNDFSQPDLNKLMKQLLRIIITQYIGNKPLKSRIAYKQLFTPSS